MKTNIFLDICIIINLKQKTNMIDPIKSTSEINFTNVVRNSTNQVDNSLIDIKNTPYIKVIENQKNEFFFSVLFLSNKGSEVVKTSTEKIDNVIVIDIYVNTKIQTEEITLHQYLFNADNIIVDNNSNLGNLLRRNLHFKYIVNIFHADEIKKDSDYSSFAFGGSNSAGGTTDPVDKYPPGFVGIK